MTVTQVNEAAGPAAAGAPFADRSDVPPYMRGHIPGLDGLRGLAVLMVMFLHFSTPWLAATPNTLGKVFYGFAGLGWIGVDLFFVLSGFLITGILVDTKGSDRYFRNFYARRALRIFPLYYGVLLMGWVVVPWLAGVPVGRPTGQWWLWCYATSIYPLIAGSWFDITHPLGMVFHHFWSLAVEEHFYLVWPFVVFLTSRRGIVAACVVVVLGAPALRAAIVLTGTDTSAITAGELCYSMTPCRVDSLAVGGLVAMAVRAGWRKESLQRLAELLVLLGGGGLLAMWWSARLVTEEPVVAVFGYSTLAVLAAGGVLGAALLPGESVFGRAFNKGLLPFLGRYSYGIYVYHGLFASVQLLGPFSSDAIYRRIGAYLPSVVIHCVCWMALSTAVAWLSWHLYEKHLLKMKRFFEYGVGRAHVVTVG